MKEFLNMERQFLSKEAFDIYSACMYHPTWEKFYQRGLLFIKDPQVTVWGFMEDGHILGLIVIRKKQKQSGVLEGIAVSPAQQRNGLGRELIAQAYFVLSLSFLQAETDDDAVEFYRRCGFHTELFYKKYNGKQYRRYRCVFTTLSSPSS